MSGNAHIGTNNISGCDIQKHLQSMFYLLREEETLKMAVKLETARNGRTRYLVVVSRPIQQCRTDANIIDNNNTNNNNNTQSTNAQNVSLTKSCTNVGGINKCASSGSDSGNNGGTSNNITLSETNNIITSSTLSSSLASSSASSSSSSSLLRNNGGKDTNISISSTTTATKRQSYSDSAPIFNRGLVQMHTMTQTTAAHFDSLPQQCDNMINNNNNNNNINSSNNNSIDSSSNNDEQKLLQTTRNNSTTSGSVNSLCGIGGSGRVNTNSCDYQTNIRSGSSNSVNDIEESCLLGIDCNERTTVGLVLRILADTAIRLDGDGGFSVSIYGRTHIFKPVSVQAMWSALQTLHKVSAKARASNYYPGGPSHDWVSYYEDRIESEQSCLNEWHTMDSIESRRPPSPDAVRTKPTEREETERVIRTALKEIMMSVDLDEVTSKYIRSRLEEHLDMDLGEFKSFIDQEMLIILGQMDSPTEIFDHVYLGSEWNASNLEELQRNGVHHILNVTREIDNFFPGMFDYLNVRVYDDEKTNLLKHWDNTFKYITRAKKDGSKVLVHCKMGVSRSASVVIAYAMKAYNWTFNQALKHVKIKRNCIKPNKSFLSQLETYQGMLDAMKNKEKLQRSKSETNLRSVKDARLLPGSEPTPLIQALNAAEKVHLTMSERELKRFGRRPKSWSPDHVEALVLLPKQQSQSLENLTPERGVKEERTNKNVRLPCSNGQNYSVSQNQVVHLQEHTTDGSSSGSDTDVPSVKLIVSELELNAAERRMSQFLHKRHCSGTVAAQSGGGGGSVAAADTFRSKKTWDPGVTSTSVGDAAPTIDLGSSCISSSSCNSDSQSLVKNSSKSICDSPTWTSSAQIIHRATITMPASDLSSSTSSIIGTTSPFPLSSSSSSVTTGEVTSSAAINNQILGTATGTQRESYRENDLFSNQVDRVFDREERKQIRHRSSISSMPTTTTAGSGATMTIEHTKGDLLVSRQSSWSSVDSAVVLTRDTPSRHSSWGSADSRVPPSRNSSWGSYDIKSTSTGGSGGGGYMFSANTENIWPTGTVKRTKMKIEKPLVGKRICGGGVERNLIQTATTDVPLADSTAAATSKSTNHRAIDIISISDKHSKRLFLQQKDKNRCNSEETLSVETILSSLNSRLSASAPETSVIGSIAAAVKNVTKRSLKTATSIDERSPSQSTSSSAAVASAGAVTNLYGIVQNLKMNFEANTTRKDDTVTSSGGIKVKSLPSSPIAAHPERNYNDQSFLSYKNATTAVGEEINVRGLVDRYEITKTKCDSSSVSSSSSSSSANSSSSSVTTIKPRPRSVFEPKHHHHLSSAFASKPLMITHSTVIPKIDEYRRPPVPPPIVKNALGTIPITSVLVATSAKTAACKKIQQHGKTHPLTRLGLPKQRLNTAAYNTM